VIGPLVRRKQRHRHLGVGGPVDGSKVQHARSIASRDAWIDVLSGGWLESIIPPYRRDDGGDLSPACQLEVAPREGTSLGYGALQ
jgi:hypothetical protein